MSPALAVPRNDPRQYDDLVAEWWRPGGMFQILHGIAAARARLIPPAKRPGALLVDVACGGGLLAPHVAGLGYRHVGVDLGTPALRLAREHGVTPVRANAIRLPLRDEVADVVVAGEILEHVAPLPAAVRELSRVLRPGGTLVIDTLAATPVSKLLTITVAERLRVAPAGLHDSALYVDRAELVREAARYGVPLRLAGLRPALPDLARWLLRRRSGIRMVPTRITAVLFSAVGQKVIA